ncbi:hypothetical protein WJX74_005434 [Apatococcus lobatus]|uniref:Uncharacterized protein n=1 Tax=Apatococcus lobatus TaxID=904363 RepID=A0AAW1RLP3_9CHLO
MTALALYPSRPHTRNLGNWDARVGAPTPWHELGTLLEQFEVDLWPNRQEQVLLRLFTSRTGLTCPCPTWRQTLAAPHLQPCWLQSRPSAAKLCSRARHFLSVFLLRDFQICIFLENAGLLHNPAYRDDTDDEDDEECSATVAKYRPHVLAMAAELVQALLQQLVCHKLYTQQELDPGIAAATCGIQELPICAALNHDHEGLLPGPLNTLKGLFYGKDHVSTRMNITLRHCERDLRSKWGTLCSRSRFCEIVHAVASKELEVVHTMLLDAHVLGTDKNGFVKFRPADATRHWDPSFHPLESDCFSVQLDAEIAAMMRPGMMMEGSFGLLSDGTWYLGQPCQIWPSFRRNPDGTTPAVQG